MFVFIYVSSYLSTYLSVYWWGNKTRLYKEDFTETVSLELYLGSKKDLFIYSGLGKNF